MVARRKVPCYMGKRTRGRGEDPRAHPSALESTGTSGHQRGTSSSFAALGLSAQGDGSAAAAKAAPSRPKRRQKRKRGKSDPVTESPRRQRRRQRRSGVVSKAEEGLVEDKTLATLGVGISGNDLVETDPERGLPSLRLS